MKTVKIWTLLAVLFAAAGLFAGDDEANALVNEALEAEGQSDFYDAAKLYEEAELMADDSQLKVNAIKSAVMCYRKAGHLQKEFELTEKLLTRHPSQTKYDKLVKREFEIAKASYNGHRDPEFWALRGIPWLTGPDRTVEMLRKALERAPFSPEAPEGRLLLAFKLNDEGKVKEAADELRTLIKDYPAAPERKYAYLALGGVLFHLSRTGDGDGQYNRELIAVLKEYQTLYPKSKEQELVDVTLLKAKDVQARRLHGLAGYYRRTGHQEAAQRYLNTVLRDYPDTETASQAEAMLVTMDKTYTPDGFREEVKSRIPTYPKHGIPAEESKLLIVPENSNGRFLLPIYDISNKQAKEKEKGEK